MDSNTRAMLVRTVASLSVAAAALFLGLAVLAAGGDDGDTVDTRADVKGARVENEAVTPPADPTTPTTAVPAPPGPTPATETQVARFEHGAFFTYEEDPMRNVAGSATVVVRNEGEVSITVAGAAEGDRAVIRATVENATGSTIEFPDGLSVRVEIEHDGRPWRTLEPSDRSVTALAPGESVTVSTEVALDAYGEYGLSGEVRYQVR